MPVNSLATSGHFHNQLTDVKIVRITSGQVHTLEKCIIEVGLSLDLFSKTHKDDFVTFKFKSDYFIFKMKKVNVDDYEITKKSTYVRSETTFRANWATAYTNFKQWVEQIAQEVENQKKLFISAEKKVENHIMNPLFRRISPKFCIIFNQASEAERLGLNEICGIGYRKAYEFLIKDYVLGQNPGEDPDKIKNMLISDVVSKYIADVHINLIVKRVIWLGNDHAHYLPVFKNKTIDHLKGLIYKTMAWMEAHEKLRKLRIDAEKIEKQMPYKNKRI